MIRYVINDAGDDERQQVYERRKRAIGEAWETPPFSSPNVRTAPSPPEQPATTAEEAHERMVERMRNAWKDPVQ